MIQNNHRITTLVDGVFAIVMTLLVFDFKIPHVVEASVDALLSGKLWLLWPRFVSYIVSCIVLGIFWIYHHNQFRYIIKIDRNLLWINILFIIAVAFVPFSAALIAEYSTHKAAIIVYGVNLIAIGQVLNLHWRYATTELRLVSKDLTPEIINGVNGKLVGSNVLYSAAVISSFLTPYISLIIYILVPLYHIRPAKYSKHHLK